MTEELRPDILRLVLSESDSPMEGGKVSFEIRIEGTNGFGRPTRDEIRRAADEATLPGERVLDEHWSEYDWGATGLTSMLLEIVLAYGLTKALDSLGGWVRSHWEPTMASVETADQAADAVTKHLKTVHKIDSVEIVESNMTGPHSWSVIARSSEFTYDATVEAGHFLLIRATRRDQGT